MKQPVLHALIFDVDGTLADTERLHLAAFNHAFVELGLNWHWDEALYTGLLEISGGKERIAYYWSQVHGEIKAIDGRALANTVERVHDLKTATYESLVRNGALSLRPGILGLIESAFQDGLQLAIATTTSPVNIAVLLQTAMGAHWADRFKIIEDASTASRKKPDPLVYRQTLHRLGLPANQCLAFEDSANGLRSARGAGLETIITPNAFTAHHDFKGALRILPTLEGIQVADLRRWHAGAAKHHPATI